MRLSKHLLIAALGCLALGSAACLAMTTANPLQAAADRTVGQARRLQAAIESELKSGCVQDDEGGKRLCGRSKLMIDELHDETSRLADEVKARPAELRKKAVSAIRFFRDTDLDLHYVSTSANPYDETRQIETYEDGDGNEYWVDPRNDALIQVGPGARPDKKAYKTRPDDRLPVSELRAIAISLIERPWPDFKNRMSSLHPLEDNKGKEVYFFRWDDFSSPVAEGDLPPFIQVGLHADGRLASFTDTLRR